MRKAQERGVIVELVLFCLMYSDDHHWQAAPLHPDNNLQGEAWRGLHHRRFLTLDNPDLVARQKAVTRKIVSELRDFPNVYFEVANEPAPASNESELERENFAWHEVIINEILAAEASLPPESRHLIAYNDHYNAGRGIAPIPREKQVGILNIHYLPRLAEVLSEYATGKVLSLDETRWIAHPKYPEYANTMKPVSGRLESWEFLLGGGAIYNGLNYAYQVDNPKGTHPESDEFKGYLQKLKQFVEQFGLARMRQDSSVLAGGLPAASFGRAISEPGKQYGIYIHHGSYGQGRGRYEPNDKPQTLDLVVYLPAGSYTAEWIRPADLVVLETQNLKNHSGGRAALLTSPTHTEDIALRILAQ